MSCPLHVQGTLGWVEKEGVGGLKQTCHYSADMFIVPDENIKILNILDFADGSTTLGNS